MLRFSRLGRCVVGVVLGVLVVGVGPVWATTGHGFAGRFGGLGPGDGQFDQFQGNGPESVAVMPSTGEVFTSDQGPAAGRPRVQRFSGGGVFASGFSLEPQHAGSGALAVDPAGGGAVYVDSWIDFGAVVKYSVGGVFAYALDASGSGTTLLGAFNGGVMAVDPVDGTVYASATNDLTGAPVIDSFSQTTGAFMASFDGAGSPEGVFQCVGGLAVDGLHRVYVLEPCKGSPDPGSGIPRGRVDRFSATGVWEAAVDDGSNGVLSAVAADPVSSEVYVAKTGPVGALITHYSPGGDTPVYTFDASKVGGIRALAASGDGTVYASDATRPFVARFTRFDGPTVTTDTATAVGPRSATINGTINPEGAASSYHFEYGTDQTYGSRTPEVSVGAGSSPVAASAVIEDLDPNLTYHYRVVGTNGSGSIVGADGLLLTAPGPATVSDPFASVITPRSATLHANVNPNRANSGSGFAVTYFFEYGTTTAYGTTAGSGTLCFLFFGPPCGGVDQPVLAQLSGLEPDTTYHFRVVADNGTGGPQLGADQTFITAPAAGAGARDVTTQRATLTATINPHGVPTSYHFRYGPTSSYGASTSEVDAGAGNGPQSVSAPVSGLSPATTYHVQVVATSDNGVTRFGGDGLLRTADAPTAEAISPTSVSIDAATLAGEVNTYGLTGTYHFDITSLDSPYAVSTSERPVAGGVSAQRVQTAINGLPAGETFVVALTITSNDSSQVSDQITFATPPVPRTFPSSPTDDTTAAYGCGVPRLDAYNAKPKPGQTITITGQDLGLSSNIVLADRTLVPTEWSTTGFKIQLPDDATGTLALTIDCRHRSNTIAIALYHQPDNTFTITHRTITATTATVTVKVAGPGKLQSTGPKTKPATVTIKKPGNTTIKITLTNTAIKALKHTKSHTLKTTSSLRYTPAGGQPTTKTLILTYKTTQATAKARR